MKTQFNMVCRGSWLSLTQAEIFKKKVHARFPAVEINTIVRETAGDKEQSTPLHLVEGKDFFTRDIQDFLRSGQADFAVHSMKDVSSEHFFRESHYAIIDREDLKDVAIFNETVLDKIKNGEQIIIGTSSPRRCNMATTFLQNALPRFGSQPIHIEAIPIRGNVDVRLQKLTDGQYDGIILAAAGLNRLLNYDPAKEKVSRLLKDKKLMVLPLFECPPAAGQGAIVAETTMNNPDAIELLRAINNDQLKIAIQKERVYAQEYGYGCSQQFGAFHADLETISFTYASGKDGNAEPFTRWDFDVKLDLQNKELFSTSDYMQDFFSHEFLNDARIDEKAKAFFVSSHKAVHSLSIERKIRQKRVWAAGTRTWFELARKGIWVEGSADGLGLEFVQPTLESSLIGLSKNEIQILTNEDSLHHWQDDGWNALSTYKLIPRMAIEVVEGISHADIIFWTSFQQYLLCRSMLKPGVQHGCLPGKTAKLFLQRGIQPMVFPGIKAFNEWKAKYSTVTSEG